MLPNIQNKTEPYMRDMHAVGYVMAAAGYDASSINGQQNAVTGSCNIVINSQVP